MITLQDLKDKINEIESDLPDNLDLSMIPLQHNLTDDYNDLDVEVYRNLGFYYSNIIIDGNAT